MSIERLRELLALGPAGRSPEQGTEFDELWGERRREQFAAIPRPNCCEAIQKYPVLNFSTYSGPDGYLKGGRWVIRVSEQFWYDFMVGELDEYIRGIPDPEYCPFCGTHVPSMILKNPPPPNICRVTDGGYYCDTCHERLDGCICDPPGAAFEACIDPPLETIPNNGPPFESESDEP